MKTKIIIGILFLAAVAGVVLWPDKTMDVQRGTLPGGFTAHLIEPTSNNAVAGLILENTPYLFSFSGLGEGRTAEDIHGLAFQVDVNEQTVLEISEVPGGKDRLASIAVAIRGKIYVIGGYTVAEDGSEISTPEVFAFDPVDLTYSPVAPIPIPVDDTVAFGYAERYIYLVSGWYDDGNVGNVQVYDTFENIWFEATPYPGSPVFGHAGGISGNRFLIADGVAVLGVDDEGRRRFGAVDEAYMGTINPENPSEITWERVNPHPGHPLYRMAATGVPGENLVVFAGGSANPYNYNGIGYNGEPSQPLATVFGFDLVQREWHVYGEKPLATMDHRGLVYLGGRFYILGGMGQDQEVLDAVTWFTLGDEE